MDGVGRATLGHVAVVWWIGLWLCLASRAGAFCPRGCACDEAIPSARCIQSHMDTVPILLNPNLRELHLAHNLLTSIAQAFVFYDHLTQLDLSHNHIRSLGSGNFEAQKHLEELRLSYNNLTEIGPRSFEGLKSLRHLDLSHNSVSKLDSSAFNDLGNLRVLVLAHNELTILYERSFRALRRLSVLNVCDNRLREIQTPALKNLVELEALDLCRNKITEIAENSIPNEFLKSLSLESNAISRVSELAFYRVHRLQKLNLSKNLMSSLPVKALSSLISLDSLSVSSNNFSEVPEGAFRHLSQLVNLELSGCRNLQYIHPGAFRHCPNLQVLTLSHNSRLAFLHGALLAHVPRLRQLNLRSCGLRTLREDQLPWTSLTTFDIRDNPLVCNCSLQWLVQLANTPNTSIAVEDVTCVAPQAYRGVPLSRLAPSDLACLEYLHVVAGVVVIVVTLILLFTLVIVICRYRHRYKSDNLCRSWSDKNIAPWLPDDLTAANKHIMANEYIYHTYSSFRKVPVTEV